MDTILKSILKCNKSSREMEFLTWTVSFGLAAMYCFTTHYAVEEETGRLRHMGKTPANYNNYIQPTVTCIFILINDVTYKSSSPRLSSRQRRRH